MRRPKLGRKLACALLCGVVVALVLAFCTVRMPSKEIPTTAPIQALVLPDKSSKVVVAAANHGLPKRLQIPALNIDAAILYMGVNKSGAMETPGNAVDVGWYKYGALPGNNGSAVIAGHIDGSKGEPGVFSRLAELKPGDILTVSDNLNGSASFTVKDLKVYDQDEQPDEVFNSSQGSHLNLITCTGSWDASNHRFLKRLVVFADATVTR